MTGDVGWAFAIGAGRHLDYRVIAAPDFLVRSGEYGVLDRVPPTKAAQRPLVIETTTSRGQHLTLACSTQVITAQDIADPQHPSTENADTSDEQNRPLRLIYGFATQGTRTVNVDPSDMDAARAAALRAYRSFLANEEGFHVVSSTAFRLQSELTGREAGNGTRAPTEPRQATYLTPQWVTPADTGNAGRPRRAVLIAVAGILFAVMVLLVFWLWPRPTPCPAPTTGRADTATTSPTTSPTTSATDNCP